MTALDRRVQLLEDRLRARETELEEARAALVRFAAAASHDLRQPVAAIGLLADLIRDQAGTDALRELARLMERAALSLEIQIKALLNPASSESDPAWRQPTTLLGPQAPADGMPNGFLAGKHVLLVEDHPELRDALPQCLQAWSATTDPFSGLQAMRAALDADDIATPDLLITDLRLPDGDGLAVIAHARARWPDLPVLVITGDTDPALMARLADSGVPVLHKPFRADALRIALHRLAAGAGDG